jgi:hypothetical protein
VEMKIQEDEILNEKVFVIWWTILMGSVIIYQHTKKDIIEILARSRIEFEISEAKKRLKMH